jgi:lipoprotein-anchoring transpeptidase ErfK/SrfK
MRHRRILAAVLAGAFLSACASSETPSDPTPANTATPTAPTGSTGPTPQPTAEPPSRLERTVQTIADGEGDFVAIPRIRYVPMWKRVGSEDADYAFDTRHPDGGPTPMLIADARLDDGESAWFEVYLPIRPNGSTGWVSGDDVRVQARHDRLEVDLSERLLEHYRDGELVHRFRVGVGTDQYPTGTGTFYVWVKVPFTNPNQPYGIMALGLSGFSPVISDWPGEGRMAVHGTPNASDRGREVSHGCVRVYNRDMESLVDLPLGTPVAITR